MRSAPITKALQELERARANVKAVSNRQIRGVDERAMLEATANAWFFSHRPAVLADADTSLLSAVDEHYKVILKGADRNTSKHVYLAVMTEAKAALIELKAHLVIVNVAADAAPDFSPLTKDAEMQALLERRWIECTKCVAAKAHLAGIVMMGGLLEALFVARANQVADKSVLFKTGSVPTDSTTGKPLALDKWMLNTYIQVGHDLKWITKSARDVASVLGEFRNYIHPAKERRHGVSLEEQDGVMLWGVTKNVTTQLLTSVK